MNFPEFNFSEDTKDFESDEQLLESEQMKGKSFDQGHYELKIVDAYWIGPANDSSWYKLKVIYGTGLEGDTRTISDLVMVPTTLGLNYCKPGGKPTLLVWTNMCAPFMKALEGVAKQSNIEKILVKYFSKTENHVIEVYDRDVGEKVEKTIAKVINLVGNTIELKIGYPGYYFDRIEDSEQFGIFLKGELVTKTNQETGERVELIADSVDDVKLLAQEWDITLSYKSVVKYFPKKSVGGSDAFANL